MQEQEEVMTEQFNTKLPIGMSQEVKVTAANFGVKMQKLNSAIFKLALFLKENGTLKETLQDADNVYSLACLKTARNHLAKMHYDIAALDEEITKAEAFLTR